MTGHPEQAPAGGGGLSPGVRGVALIAAMALFMTFLDATIIVTSLPQMSASFAVTPVEMNLAITAYLLAMAAFVPLSGWFAERFGAKRVFAAAIGLFSLASMACALAPTLPFFVAGRIAQGLGGAMIVPVGRLIALRRAEGQEIVHATALISWPALIAPVAGPVLGGAITTMLDWRWNFYINAPLGLAAIVLVLVFVPDHREETSRRLDLVGAMATGTALGVMIFALDRMARPDADLGAVWLLLFALAAACGAVLWFRSSGNPLLDLTLFRLPTFGVSTRDAGLLQLIAISATPFLIPLMLQEVWGLSAFEAGLTLMAYFAGNLVMKTVTTPILRWLGFRTVIIGNGAFLAGTIAACGLLAPGFPHAAMIVLLFVAGAARSLQMTALNTLAFAEVPGHRRSSAATLATMMQQLSLALGTALAALCLKASLHWRGDAALDLVDFRQTFFALGVVATLGTIAAFRLSGEAGRHVSGHRARQARGGQRK